MDEETGQGRRVHHNYAWSATFVGTLYLDDLRGIEALCRDLTIEPIYWGLVGGEEYLSASVSADTLADVVASRHEVPGTPTLSLTAGRSREFAPPVVTLGSDRGGRTQIKTAASGVENREVFERVTRGLREVTQRADQTTIIQRSSTWLDQHDTIASFVAAPLVAFLSVATALLAVWFATLLVQFDDPARIGIYGSAFSMMVLVVGRAIWLGRWAPPPFDLSRNRPAGKPGGPAFVQRDIAIALVMLAIGLVVSVILAS